MVRIGALDMLQNLPAGQIWPLAAPLLSDPVRGVRIRAPREIRQVKATIKDELNLSVGKATLRLRLHNDSASVFAGLNVPQQNNHRCNANISGQAAEVFSFRPAENSWVFAARWPNAENGEWLEAVITSSNVEDTAKLRRTLFTIVFPAKTP